MLLKIVQVGEPVLREAARILTAEEIRSREIQKLIEDMRETMHKAPGVGLAAPQIGRSLQLAVIEDKPEYMKDVDESFLRERERRPVPFHAIINPKNYFVGRRSGRFLRRMFESGRFYRDCAPRSQGARRLSRCKGQA